MFTKFKIVVLTKLKDYSSYILDKKDSYVDDRFVKKGGDNTMKSDTNGKAMRKSKKSSVILIAQVTFVGALVILLYVNVNYFPSGEHKRSKEETVREVPRVQSTTETWVLQPLGSLLNSFIDGDDLAVNEHRILDMEKKARSRLPEYFDIAADDESEEPSYDEETFIPLEDLVENDNKTTNYSLKDKGGKTFKGNNDVDVLEMTLGDSSINTSNDRTESNESLLYKTDHTINETVHLEVNQSDYNTVSILETHENESSTSSSTNNGTSSTSTVSVAVNNSKTMSEQEQKAVNETDQQNITSNDHLDNRSKNQTIEINSSSNGLESVKDTDSEVKISRNYTSTLSSTGNCTGGNCTVQSKHNFTEENLSKDDDCRNCFQHNFKYVIDSKYICKTNAEQKEIDLLILITSAHENYERRFALRKTWLSQTKKNTGNVRYAFLLGKVTTASAGKLVWKESKKFHDMIKEDFFDTYHNLTYKTIMGMKWASRKCANAKFVMKTDDDMYINIDALLKSIKSRETELQRNIGGHCDEMGKVPIRDTKSKWYASRKSFARDIYPSYCSGTAYVTSMSVAKTLYSISATVPFFHLEDVYVGLCLRKAGLGVVDIPGFHLDRPRVDLCRYKRDLISVHYMTPHLLYLTWEKQC